MAEKLTIFLVEDDEAARDLIIKEIRSLKDSCTLCGYAAGETRAFEEISRLQPDAVILDLELNRGDGDGVSLLKRIKAPSFPYNPYVFITTNNISTYTHEAVRRLGGDFIMTKNEGNYSPRGVVTFLLNIAPVILGHGGKNRLPAEYAPDKPDEKQLRRRMHYELNLLGVSNKSLGYGYITEAVILAYNGDGARLAQRVAALTGKNEQSVERAMQNAISRTWTTGDPDALSKLYTAHIRPDRGMPTVTEFIYYYVQKLRE